MRVKVILVNKMRAPLLKDEVNIPFIPRINDTLIILAEAYKVNEVVIDTDSQSYHVNVK